METEEQYQHRVLAEINRELRDCRPGLLGEVDVVSFVSRSAGRGRARQPREVTLVGYCGNYYVVTNGEIRSRGQASVAPDRVAFEVLSHLPEDERTTDRLLEIVACY